MQLKMKQAGEMLAKILVVIMVLASINAPGFVNAATRTVAQWTGMEAMELPSNAGNWLYHFTLLSDTNGLAVARILCNESGAVFATSNDMVNWELVSVAPWNDFYLNGRYFWSTSIGIASRTGFLDTPQVTDFGRELMWPDLSQFNEGLRVATWETVGFSSNGDEWYFISADELPRGSYTHNVFPISGNRLIATAMNGDIATVYMRNLSGGEWTEISSLRMNFPGWFWFNGEFLQIERGWGDTHEVMRTYDFATWVRATPPYYPWVIHYRPTYTINRPMSVIHLPYLHNGDVRWGFVATLADGSTHQLRITNGGREVLPANLPSGIAGIENFAWAREAAEFAIGNGLMNMRGHHDPSLSWNAGRGDFLGGLMQVFNVQPPATPVPGFQPFVDLEVDWEQWKPGRWNWNDEGICCCDNMNLLNTARMHGFVDGVGENRFAPNNSITRQEAFVMMYNVMNRLGLVDSANVSVLNQFGDNGQIAEWARVATASLVSAGIVTGVGGNINPLGNLTRAEMFVLMHRVSQLA